MYLKKESKSYKINQTTGLRKTELDLYHHDLDMFL